MTERPPHNPNMAFEGSGYEDPLNDGHSNDYDWTQDVPPNLGDDMRDADPDDDAGRDGPASAPPISNASTRRWLGKKAPPIEFIADGLIPRSMVTLMTAEGGAGKSLLDQLACAVIPADLPFLGKKVIRGAAAGIFAE